MNRMNETAVSYPDRDSSRVLQFVGSSARRRTAGRREGFPLPWGLLPATVCCQPLTVGSMPKDDNYDGDWLGDVRQGTGTCLFSNGDKYEGKWQSDVREGQGSCAFANGDSFTGAWHSDMRWGSGAQTFASGDRYAGGWLDDVRHGKCVFWIHLSA